MAGCSRYGEMKEDLKGELIERLECYERNDNSGREDAVDMGDTFEMSLPKESDYKGLNTSRKMPKLTSAILEHYYSQYGVTVPEKAKVLYEEKYLRSVRVAERKNITYVKARCHAEMKKQVVYIVDMSLNDSGMILEAQCECAVGMGPGAHCKHVGVLLYGLLDFTVMGMLSISEVCTEVLQSFSHPKKFFRSPVKAQDLRLLNSKHDLRTFDPRPTEYRNKANYEYHFRNVILNTPSAIPLKRLYPPAMKHAIAHDHCYLSSDAEEQFLKNAGISEISAMLLRFVSPLCCRAVAACGVKNDRSA